MSQYHKECWVPKNWCFWSVVLMKTLESPLDSKEIKAVRKSTLNIQWKDWCWSWSSNTLVTWCEDPTHWKRPYAGEDWGQEEKGAIEMAGWHHRLNGHEFEQIPGESEGQGSLTCCSPWGCNDSDMTNNNKTMRYTLNAQLKYRFLE